MAKDERPIPDLAESSIHRDRIILSGAGRARSSSSTILSIALMLILAGTGVIAYLSILSSATLNFISSTSELQNEAEQLKWRVIDMSAASSRPIVTTQTELTASFRSRLLEWQAGDQPGLAQSQVDELIRRGRQFAGQAEYAWIASNRSLYTDSQATDELTSANQVAIERVNNHPFPSSLHQLQSTLIQFEDKLTWLNLLLAMLVALIGISGVSYGVIRLRKVHHPILTTARLSPEPEQSGPVRNQTMVAGLTSGSAAMEFAESEERSIPSQAEQSTPAEPVLNTEQMLDNMDGDRESVAMLLDIFLKEHADDAKRLSESLDNGRYDDVSLIAHSLKSVASSFGAQSLRKIAECIEHRCKQGSAVRPEDIVQLDEAIVALKAAIIEYLQVDSNAAEAVQIEEYTQVETAIFDSDDIQEAELQPADVSLSSALMAKREDEPLALLDIAYVLDSMDDDGESVKMLLEIFIEEHALDAKKLQQDVYQCAPDAISETALRLVHSLKGVASSLGAEALKRQVVIIESCYKQQQVVADAEYRKLAMVLDDTVGAASCYLAEQSAVVA